MRTYNMREPSGMFYGRGSRSRENNEKPIGMAYVPWQRLENIYEPEKALSRGTIFPELDLPFYGGRGSRIR